MTRKYDKLGLPNPNHKTELGWIFGKQRIQVGLWVGIFLFDLENRVTTQKLRQDRGVQMTRKSGQLGLPNPNHKRLSRVRFFLK